MITKPRKKNNIKQQHLHTFIMKEQSFQRLRSINRNRHFKHLFWNDNLSHFVQGSNTGNCQVPGCNWAGPVSQNPLWHFDATLKPWGTLWSFLGNSHVGLLGDCRWFKRSPRKGFSWSPTSPHHQLTEPTMESVGRRFKMGYWCPEVRSRALLDCLSLFFFQSRTWCAPFVFAVLC